MGRPEKCPTCQQTDCPHLVRILADWMDEADA